MRSSLIDGMGSEDAASVTPTNGLGLATAFRIYNPAIRNRDDLAKNMYYPIAYRLDRWGYDLPRYRVDSELVARVLTKGKLQARKEISPCPEPCRVVRHRSQ
jgi:hypothetical protein